MPSLVAHAARDRTRTLAWLILLPAASLARTALAQTPSPLQEWQYPGGIILAKLFEPPLPEWRTIVGLSAAVAPVFPGSRHERGEGGPVFNVRYRDIAYVSAGEGLGVDLLRGLHYRAGLSLGYDLGRKVSADRGHLEGLGDIDPDATVKAYGAWVISKYFPLVLRADVRRFIGRSDSVGDVEAYVPLPGSSHRFVMFAGPSYTFADQHYMQRWFGIGGAQARASGYPGYTPQGGSLAKGIGFSATWFVTPHFLLSTDDAFSRLMGGASASPITEQRTQRVWTLAALYQF